MEDRMDFYLNTGAVVRDRDCCSPIQMSGTVKEGTTIIIILLW